MSFRSTSLLALAASLALAGCNKAPETTDNAMVNVDDSVDLNGATFNDEAPVIEDSASEATPAIAVAAVPKPPAGATAADTAPLTEAGAIEAEIRAGRDIERVRYGEGWAWTRGGKILRTADRQGSNVAYFRGGEDRPFFVQREGRAYAYQGDKPTRVFGTDGQIREPDADRARQGAEAIRDARIQRQQAETARNQARNRGDREPRRPDAMPSPTPAPSPSAAPTRTPRDRDREGRPGMRPRPTPTPQ
jgi:hypothetical protein